MGPGTDLIIFSLSRFDDPISSVGFSYAKAFAKQGRVFFIEHPFTWKDVFNGKNRSAIDKRNPLWREGSSHLKDPTIPDDITYIVPPRMLPMNFLPQGMFYENLRKRNDSLMIRLLEKVIKDHSIREFVFFNVFDPFYLNEFPKTIKPLCKAYLSLDDSSEVKYTARHGARREAGIIRHWDFAFATGKALCRKLSTHGNPVHYLPNAADFSIFSAESETKLPIPEDLRPFAGKKTIGYVGSIEYRTDFALLNQLAIDHQDKQLILIGPVSAEAMALLPKLDNVTMLGPKPLEALPAYLQHLDLLIIPFLCNTLTQSIYPMKLHEYLASGKPVVTTNFSEDLQEFEDHIYIAGSQEAFSSMIDVALAEDNAEKRVARVEVAQQNTWPARVLQFWQTIERPELK